MTLITSRASCDAKYTFKNTLSKNSLSENTLSENTLSENTLSKNTLLKNSEKYTIDHVFSIDVAATPH